MADKKELKKLRETQKAVKAMLKDAVLQLYSVRLQADAEPYHRATMDTVKGLLDKCIKLL